MSGRRVSDLSSNERVSTHARARLERGLPSCQAVNAHLAGAAVQLLLLLLFRPRCNGHLSRRLVKDAVEPRQLRHAVTVGVRMAECKIYGLIAPAIQRHAVRKTYREVRWLFCRADKGDGAFCDSCPIRL